MSEFKISASIVCADLLNLESEIKILEESGVDFIHFDVMDGMFVPRYGLPPEVITGIKKVSPLPVDVHMMVVNPEPYIKSFAEAGTDIFYVHVEGNNHLHRTIKMIRDNGMKPGVVLNLSTPLSVLDYVLEDIDYVMLMGINPGIVGHKIIPKVLDKISELSEKIKDKNIEIMVDGGVSLDSYKEMVNKGASILVCGSSTIFRPQDGTIKENVERMRR